MSVLNLSTPELRVAYWLKKARLFWSKVAIVDDCWLWQGGLAPSGYGYFTIKPVRNVHAHRAAWILTFGAIPDGLFVLHGCDNKRCVNPAHLFLGTQRDNIRDFDGKGLRQRGEQHPRTRHTAEDIREMRRLRAEEGLSFRAIGQRFGIRAEAVWKIFHGKRWGHV